MPSFGMFRDALATMTSGEMSNWMASVEIAETGLDGGGGQSCPCRMTLPAQLYQASKTRRTLARKAARRSGVVWFMS